MDSAPISALPPEVLHETLKYLPIATLLRFGRTSRRNYSAANLALQHLRLAIFSKPLHGDLAFLGSSTFEDFDTDPKDLCYDDPCRNQVIVISALPPFNPPRSQTRTPSAPLLSPAQYRDKLFQTHNTLACSILSTPTLTSLKSLSLYIYHINSSSLAEVLATHFPSLRELRLNFCHPYVHDACLPAQYWVKPVYLQPSPLWNALAGMGDRSIANLRLRKLEKLTLERAGINSFQLRRWIERNPDLKELRLRNVAGVDMEFVQWLGTYYGGSETDKPGATRPARLRTLALDMCSALIVASADDLSWLDSLLDLGIREAFDEDQCSTLQVLSLSSSKSVSATALCAYFESHRPAIQQLTLPDGQALVPKRRKRSRSESYTQYKYPSSSSKCRKRPQPKMPQSSPNNEEVGQSQSNDELDTGDVGIQALSIAHSDSDESSDDDNLYASSSPISYLRLRNRIKLGKDGKPSDIIEPDPNAR